MLGSINAGLLFQQLAYWSNTKADSEPGYGAWIWKTQAELGVSRVTLGHPSLLPTTREEVEREACMTLDHTPQGAPEYELAPIGE